MVKRQEVVLLDEGWDPTKYVAVGLRNVGCSVHIVTASAEGERPDAKFLGRQITAEAAPRVQNERYIEAVGAILARRPSAHVLAMTEEILNRIWDAAPVWAARLFPSFEPWQRQLFRDKLLLSEHVSHAGVRIPMQRLISMVDNPDAAIPREAIREFGLPVVVKGTMGCGGARVRIAHTEQDALDAAVRMAVAGKCFLQEYVAGQSFGVGGLFRGGQPIRMYVFKPIERAHATGPYLRLQSEADPAPIEFALGVFRALDWTGIGFMEGIRRADGKIFFIEFNPRPWGSTAASARAGVDLFGPLARMLAGETPTPDLSFITDKRTTVFPQAASARLRKGGIRALASLVREPHLWLDAPWSQPGLVAHLARQLWWKWRDGTLKRIDPAPDPSRAMGENRQSSKSFEPSSIEAHES